MANQLSSFKQKLLSGEDVTLDFVGDSITWGLNHCSPEETYVAFFARMFARWFGEYNVVRYDGRVDSEALPIAAFEGPIPVGGKNGSPVAAIIRNGVGGNTVRRAIRRKHNFIGEMPNGKDADLTFFMFGINDALKCDDSKYVTPERFLQDYRELLDLTAHLGARILISPTYNGTSYPLDAYAEATKLLAEEAGLPFFDAHKLWTDHYRAEAPHFGEGEWLSDSKTDACHFSPKGARVTAAFLFDEFCRLFAEA